LEFQTIQEESKDLKSQTIQSDPNNLEPQTIQSDLNYSEPQDDLQDWQNILSDKQLLEKIKEIELYEDIIRKILKDTKEDSTLNIEYKSLLKTFDNEEEYDSINSEDSEYGSAANSDTETICQLPWIEQEKEHENQFTVSNCCCELCADIKIIEKSSNSDSKE
jgi:hypothetical protein